MHFVMLLSRDWLGQGMWLLPTLLESQLMMDWYLIAHGIKHSEWVCIVLASCVLKQWINGVPKTFGIPFNEGLLFPRMKSRGRVDCNKRWKAKNILDSLQRDLKRYSLYQGETAQSFRHGGTVNSLETGQNLERTMYLAYMKNRTTAQN